MNKNEKLIIENLNHHLSNNDKMISEIKDAIFEIINIEIKDRINDDLNDDSNIRFYKIRNEYFKSIIGELKND